MLATLITNGMTQFKLYVTNKYLTTFVNGSKLLITTIYNKYKVNRSLDNVF